MPKTPRRDAPIHPGEILREEFLKPADLTVYRVAKDCGLLLPRVNEIVHGQRAITADTALRFGQYFKTSPEFWMNLQTAYDLDVARDRADAAEPVWTQTVSALGKVPKAMAAFMTPHPLTPAFAKKARADRPRSRRVSKKASR
jgi:addiction module HigA family antidote